MILLKRKNVIRATAALCCALTAGSAAISSSAMEKTLDCTYLKITGNGFVAGTLNGVEARYNLSGPTLYCVELVHRYYQEVYGVKIRCNDGGPVVEDNDDLYFELTDEPKTGDVMYGSAAARGRGYNHWGLVKDCDGETLTVFEQNWRWNGQAGVDRVIEYPTESYEIYTLKSRSGAAVRPVNGGASLWAEPYLARAAEMGVADLRSGYGEPVTRDDFCQMALNLLERAGEPVEGTGAAGAMAAGLVSDCDGSRLITREEAACIASRLSERLGRPQLALPAALDSYADASEIAFWAQESVAQMTVSGLMNGLVGCFGPKNTLTNEQAVTLMVRLDDLGSTATYQQARVPAGGVAALAAERVLEGRLPSMERTFG